MPIVMPPKFWRSVLGDDSGSRLYWELVDPGLAEHCSLHHHEYLNAGMFLTLHELRSGYAVENLQRIRGVRARPPRRELPRRNSIRQKAKSIREWCWAASGRPRRLFTVGSNWVQRREYRSVRDDLNSV